MIFMSIDQSQRRKTPRPMTEVIALNSMWAEHHYKTYFELAQSRVMNSGHYVGLVAATKSI